eukprot:c20665_g1_i1 orf=236-619(-)
MSHNDSHEFDTDTSSSIEQQDFQAEEGHQATQLEKKFKLSCVSCIDAIWFCYTPVHQMKEYYREGTFDSCRKKWSELFDCFYLRTKPDAEVQAILGARERNKPHLWKLRSREEASKEWDKLFGHLQD